MNYCMQVQDMTTPYTDNYESGQLPPVASDIAMRNTLWHDGLTYQASYNISIGETISTGTPLPDP